MVAIKLLISAITLFTAIHTASATICWDCNSNINPLCTSFDKSKFATVNCDYPPAQYQKALIDAGIQIDRSGKLRSPAQSFCRKIVQTGSDGERVIRGCGYLHETDPELNAKLRKGECVDKSNPSKIGLKYCNCYENECNSSYAVKFSWPYLLLLAWFAFKLY